MCLTPDARSPAWCIRGKTASPNNLRSGANSRNATCIPSAARPREPDQLVDHVFGAAYDLDVAAKGAMLVAVRLPGDRVSAALMRYEAFDRAVIGRIEDRRVVLLRLAVRLAADKHRVYDRAQLPAALRPGSFYDGIMRGENGKRCVDFVAGGAGNEDEVGMRRGVVDAGRGPRRIEGTPSH
jgi:hypothetical protein